MFDQCRRFPLGSEAGLPAPETIDWAEALTQLDKVALDPQAIDDTLGVLLKYQDDIAKIQGSEAASATRRSGSFSLAPSNLATDSKKVKMRS